MSRTASYATMTVDTVDPPAWEQAGAAWGHAALDWAYMFEPYARDAIEELFSSLDVGVGSDLLDVACGSGYALGRAERLGACTAGIDASFDLIDIARRRAPTADLRAGDMFDLPWKHDSFDVVTAFTGDWGLRRCPARGQAGPATGRPHRPDVLGAG